VLPTLRYVYPSKPHNKSVMPKPLTKDQLAQNGLFSKECQRHWRDARREVRVQLGMFLAAAEKRGRGLVEAEDRDVLVASGLRLLGVAKYRQRPNFQGPASDRAACCLPRWRVFGDEARRLFNGLFSNGPSNGTWKRKPVKHGPEAETPSSKPRWTALLNDAVEKAVENAVVTDGAWRRRLDPFVKTGVFERPLSDLSPTPSRRSQRTSLSEETATPD